MGNRAPVLLWRGADWVEASGGNRWGQKVDGVVIRRAVEADLAELLGMVQALTRHHADEPRVTLETLERDVLGAVPWFHVLVAEGAAGLLGYAALLPLARLGYGERGMDLHHLFVTEAARRGGVGAALLQAAEDFGIGLGCTYLIIGTHPDNWSAQQYYQHRGYHPMGNTSVRFMRRLAVVEG